MPGDLRERNSELSRIDALLAAAQAGDGGVLGITGPAGIGKTSLLETARERARLAQIRVLSARGGELEGGFSFGVTRQLFEPLLAGAGGAERDALLAGAARRALPPIEDIAPAQPAGEPPFAVIHGLYWLVANASQRSPLLLAIDDLHWADQASLRFLRYLADRLAGLPVALLATWRPDASLAAGKAHYLARLGQLAGGVLSPGALSREAVRGLLAAAFARNPGARFAATCHAVTGGNPFLLRELIEAVRDEGIGTGDDQADRVAGLGPRSVARAVSLRVAGLGPAAVQLAQAVAILGDGAALRHAAALSGSGLAAAAVAADRLAGSGVFAPGTPLRFVHSIVRTAVHDDIPEAARGLLHAGAARLLAAERADPEAVCAHLLACEPAGSHAVVDQLRAAAQRATARGAPESTAAYLQRALAETPDVSLRAAVLHELGLAEKMILDPSAAGHLRESLELATDPVRRIAVVPDLAELLVLAGQWDAGVAVTQAALAEVGDLERERHDFPGVAVTRLQAQWVGFAAYDPSLAGELDQRLNQLLTAARQPGTGPPMLAAALAGILAWRGERPALVHALLDHALAGDRLLSRADSEPLLLAQALSATVWLDELTRAEALARKLFALSRSQGSVAALGIAALLLAGVGARRGDLVGLRQSADVLAESGAKLEHGRTLVELGAALRRANQRAAARGPLRSGLDLAYRCGAGRLAERAALELRATGARPRRALLTGLAALTPSERRIAALAARGMSNPEIAQALFITLNTVEGHLRHIYQKLSVSSRGQLPAALQSAAPNPPVHPGSG